MSKTHLVTYDNYIFNRVTLKIRINSINIIALHVMTKREW